MNEERKKYCFVKYLLKSILEYLLKHFLQACHTHQPVYIVNKGVYCGGTMVSGDDFIIGKKLGEGAGGGINYPNSP